jgi:hypothetical protein
VEEEDADEDIDMADGNTPAPARPPLASADDFPADHWEEPGSDDITPAPASASDSPADHWVEPGMDLTPPPSPVMASEDNIRDSPLPLPPNISTRSPTPPIQPSPGQTNQLETTMAQIRSEMGALRLRDRQEVQDRYDELQRRVDLGESADASLGREIQLVQERLAEEMQRMQDQLTEEMRQQRSVLQVCATEFNGVVRYLRRERTGEPTTSTPPSFNPPSIVLPATSMFPDIGSSISAFGRTVTNNVFTPDNSLLFGAADVSPIERRDSADRPTPLLIPSRPPTVVTTMPSPGTLRNMVTGPGNMPTGGQSISAPPQRATPGPPAPPATSIMPSPDTLRNVVTGPGNLPTDGQSISAPARARPGPLSRHHSRSVSGAHHRQASGGHGRK